MVLLDGCRCGNKVGFLGYRLNIGSGGKCSVDVKEKNSISLRSYQIEWHCDHLHAVIKLLCRL